MEKVYTVILAFTREKGPSGTAFQVVSAKNKEQALTKAIQMLEAHKAICLVSIKRVSRKLAKLLAEHNALGDGENE